MEMWSTDEERAGTRVMMPKVLVIEDAKEFQLMIKSALGRGLHLEIVATLAEARQKLSSERFDLILLDVTLPDGNGFEFCTEIQNDDKSMGAPIIFLSGRNNTTDKVLGLTLGAEDYVTKPF